LNIPAHLNHAPDRYRNGQDPRLGSRQRIERVAEGSAMQLMPSNSLECARERLAHRRHERKSIDDWMWTEVDYLSANRQSMIS
jgi:hypothetical protein